MDLSSGAFASLSIPRFEVVQALVSMVFNGMCIQEDINSIAHVISDVFIYFSHSGEKKKIKEQKKGREILKQLTFIVPVMF